MCTRPTSIHPSSSVSSSATSTPESPAVLEDVELLGDEGGGDASEDGGVESGGWTRSDDRGAISD